MDCLSPEWMESLTPQAKPHCSCARQLPAVWPQSFLGKTVMSICWLEEGTSWA